ncbi:MAG: hypothetical protein A2636_03955 [Elusimicrobia bacterium RIFCSPHIGHO2_01_FULL_64_10]|nr:MAG: hypothetical protein A2636_03955 [Elusimicrobia bacterium RIFCSPHIGHO2_01_FULL_64_10]
MNDNERNRNLAALISDKIRREGPMSFAQFMDMALYHPRLGYYARTGDSEDYFTSVDVHPLFARVLAKFIRLEWEKNFREGPRFTVLELGAGGGKLAGGILSWLSQEARGCFERVRYLVLESSPERLKRLGKLKKEFGPRVEVLSDPSSLWPGSLNGVVLSNEFFDALPCHRVVKRDGRIREIRVGEGFKEIEAEATPPIRSFFDWLGAAPAEGCAGEAHLLAREWTALLARALARGTVLTIDYGYESAELYSEIRPQGTALRHLRHQASRDFYRDIGLADLTAHVNFTVLSKEGAEKGLMSRPLVSQSRFLLDLGMEEILRSASESPDARTRLRASSAAKTLIHPEGLGGTFKVLLQNK